jgi:hypothetical protein
MRQPTKPELVETLDQMIDGAHAQVAREAPGRQIGRWARRGDHLRRIREIVVDYLEAAEPGE